MIKQPNILELVQQKLLERDSVTVQTLTIGKFRRFNSDRALAILYQANALAGEAGEYANIAKKIVRDELLPLDQQRVLDDKAKDLGYLNLADKRTQQGAKELADIIFYAIMSAQCLGVDLTKALVDKFNEVSEDSEFEEAKTIKIILDED